MKATSYELNDSDIYRFTNELLFRSVGLSYRSAKAKAHVAEVAAVDGPLIVGLEREPDNEFDANAIKVHADGYFIGYVDRANAELLAPVLDRDAPRRYLHDGFANGAPLIVVEWND